MSPPDASTCRALCVHNLESLYMTFIPLPSRTGKHPRVEGPSQAPGICPLLASSPSISYCTSCSEHMHSCLPRTLPCKDLIIPSFSPLPGLFLSMKKISRTVGHLSLLVGPTSPTLNLHSKIFITAHLSSTSNVLGSESSEGQERISTLVAKC